MSASRSRSDDSAHIVRVELTGALAGQSIDVDLSQLGYAGLLEDLQTGQIGSLLDQLVAVIASSSFLPEDPSQRRAALRKLSAESFFAVVSAVAGAIRLPNLS